MKNRRMPNGTYGGVRGRKTKVGRKLSFSSYSISPRIRLRGLRFLSYILTPFSTSLRSLNCWSE